MNPRIVVCLLVSIAFAVMSAGWVLVTGWGLALAFAAYTVVGSITLVLSAAAAVILEMYPRAGEPADSDPLPAQST